MSKLPDFLVLFKGTEIQATEQFNEFKIVLDSTALREIESDAFTSGLSFLNARDKLQISVVIDDGESVDYYSGGDIEDFLKELNGKLSVLEDEKIIITVRIQKEILEGVLSIYRKDNFLIFLQELSVQSILGEFNTYLQKFWFIIFESQSTVQITKTKSLWLVNEGYTGKPEGLERDLIINRTKTSCHYNLLPKNQLLAEDFNTYISEDNTLETLFNKLSIILSVAFLYDITSVQGDILDYRLNGYKSISGNLDTKTLAADPEQQYFKIYNWVYDSGNFVDKLGLARNIISLHLDASDRIELKGDPFRSIQSSYKVYEKQNIKQYIEIRNKISDQLLSFHDRANKIIETFAGGFQKSAFALFTFYISAIILKVLNKDKLVEVFTIDAAILSTAFILCSIVFYFVQRWEVRAQRKRFVNNYADLKKRYTDLLDEQDINRILNFDHEFNGDLGFIDGKYKRYTAMWFIYLTIFFSVTWLIYFIYNPYLIIKLISVFNGGCSYSCS